MNLPKKSILILIVILIIMVFVVYFLSNYSNFFQNIFSNFKSSSGDNAKDYYAKGIELYKQNEYDRAISEFKKAIEKDPGDYKAYIKIHTISNERKTLDSARICFEKLREQYPDVSCPYFALGLVQASKKDYQGAIQSYQQAIQLSPKFVDVYLELADKFNQCGQLETGIEWLNKQIASNPTDPFKYFGLGKGYQLQSDWDRVFKNVNQAIQLNPEFLAAYHLKISSLVDTGNFDEAIAIGKMALEIADKKDDPEIKVSIMMAVGKAHYYLGQYDRTLQLQIEALALARQIGSKKAVARILNNLGAIYTSLTEFNQAIDYLKQALVINQEIGEVSDNSSVYLNVGKIFAELAEYDSALLYLDKAIRIVRQTKDILTEAQILGSIAANYGYMADYVKSFAYGDSAIKIYRANRNPSGESEEMGNFGANYQELGNYARAIEYYNKAISISKQIKNAYLLQNQLGGLANVYLSLRDFQKAKDYIQQAIDVAQQIRDKSSAAAWLLDLAIVEKESGNTSKAFDELKQAMNTFVEIEDKRGEGLACADLAGIFMQRGNNDSALYYYNKSLIIAQKIGNKYGEAKTSNELGMLYQKIGNYATAFELHKKALTIGELLNASEILWESKFGLGSAYEKQGKLTDALNYYKQSVEVIESVRGSLLLEEHKSTFMENKIKVYEKLIHLQYLLHPQQYNKGFDRESFQYAERAKAKALLDLLAEAKINITTGIDSTLVKGRNRIFKTISRLQTDLRTQELSETRKKEIYQKLDEEYEQLQQIQLEIRKNNPAYYDMIYPQPLTLSQVQKNMLGEKEVLLEFVLGDEQSYLWAVNKNKSNWYPLPPRKEIEAQVGEYLSQINHPPETYRSPVSSGQNLYDVLLKPATAFWEKDCDLIIVPDGILHYLPFETLVRTIENGTPRYLIDSCNVSYAQSATVLHLIKQRPPITLAKTTQQLLAFADPVFGDEQQQQALKSKHDTLTERGSYLERGFLFPRLELTAEEVKNIARFFFQDLTKIFLRSEASEDRVKSLALDSYRIIHFATHGVLDEERPDRSCLVLSLDNKNSIEDGFLQVNEVFNLKLHAELVTLSACHTGQGKLVNGEGVVGLTRAFQYAGARSLVVSLWSINDQSTAKFMEKFYQYRQRGETKTAALRRAKLDFINGKIISWQHPFYWAPFVLQGEAN